MPRVITDKDCKPTPRFGSAAPIMEYCGAWKKANGLPLTEANRSELESERLNPSKVRCTQITPERLQRMRTRLHTISGV